MGILKPYRGEIFFGSKRIDGQPTEKIVMEGVSLSLAEKELFPQMTVRENLMLGAFNKRARKKLEENLELVLDIFPGFASVKPESWNHERRRAANARYRKSPDGRRQAPAPR
jgi:branched-chain amino acid transport system ATP-binding protein